MAKIARRKSVAVNVGGVKVGGANPIVVQSMTNTDTADVTSTVNQVMALAHAGSELVRVTVNTDAAAARRAEDRRDARQVRRARADHRRLPLQRPSAAQEVSRHAPARWRSIASIPGNVNIGKKHDDNFRTMIEAAIEYDRPVRIGVNWGSLDGALLTRMMDENNKLAGTAGRARSDAARDRGQRAAIRRSGRALRPAARTHHPERQGQRRAGSDRRLPHAGRRVRLCAAPRA